MRILSIPGVLLSLLVSLSWNPPTQIGQGVKPTIPAVSKAAIKKTEEAMQGVWRLTEFVAPRLTLNRRTDTGYCLVQGNYLSLEVHVGWLSEDNVYEHKDFQSGTYRFELDQTGRMETSTVIGMQMAGGRVPTAELPNTKRTFRVTALLDNMTWRGDDGSQFVFERMLDTRGKRDFYGRLIPDKKTASGKPKDVTGGTPPEDDGTPPEEKPDEKDGKPPEEKPPEQ
jgi:hypothetical protein